MPGPKIEGIHFIHIPKCGGTYVHNWLTSLTNHLKINFSYHSHRYFHQGVYAPPQDHLSIATVRNPFDLLVSVWCWDQHDGTGVGYGNVREHFKSFDDFVTYFCLMSDFAFAPRGDWFYSVEPFHFSCDLTGSPRSTTGVPLGDLAQLEQCLISRPFPWQDENLQDLFGLKCEWMGSASFMRPGDKVPRNYRPRFFEEGAIPWPAWFPSPQAPMELESNYAWIYQLGKSGLDYRMLYDGWYYTSFLWYSLFNWVTGELVPDIIIPIEQVDEAIETLQNSMGVTDLKIMNTMRNAGVTRGGRDYREYYSDELVEMVTTVLRPELLLFGYEFDKNQAVPIDGGVIQKKYFDHPPRPWTSLQGHIGNKKFKLGKNQC